jgi:hypothetical protein
MGIIGRTFQYQGFKARKSFFGRPRISFVGEGQTRRDNVSYIVRWPLEHLEPKLLEGRKRGRTKFRVPSSDTQDESLEGFGDGELTKDYAIRQLQPDKICRRPKVATTEKLKSCKPQSRNRRNGVQELYDSC